VLPLAVARFLHVTNEKKRAKEDEDGEDNDLVPDTRKTAKAAYFSGLTTL
jgi:hypothetical protein